jgi:RNA polymerase sigma factor (sigma-70 family)
MEAENVTLVVMAQSGDARARDELIAEHLPLLYNIVGRALSGHADVDDVVQETLLRAVRDLPGLRAPESFRSWLVAIALRQIGTHRYQRRMVSERTAVVDEASVIPADGDLEAEVILQLHVARQRGQVREAGRWLDPASRVMFSLWWQEQAGWLSREEVAAASRVSVAHAGVRLQRMREQMELARTIVTALAAEPRCPRLETTLAAWNGQPSPVWRKRIARHTRDCPGCMGTATEQVPTERLLLSIAPLTVPTALTAALAAKGLTGAAVSSPPGVVGAYAAAHGGASGTGAHSSLAAKVIHGVTAHPWVGVAAGTVLVTGAAVVSANSPGTARHVPAATTAAPRTADPSPRRTATGTPPVAPPVQPSAAPGALVPGVWSMESADEPGQYLTYVGDYAALGQVGAVSAVQTRRHASFTVVRGLADQRCVTFRAADGRYLRHSYLQLRLSSDDGSALFRRDATFCPRPGTVAGSVTLWSINYPALALRHRDGGIWLDASDGTRTFGGESSFLIHAPWA